jgi:multicomponent Na+:H+ antiporter subunit E
VKYYFSLITLLVVNWLFWSGHVANPFLLTLGLASCLMTVYMSRRMKIVDEEGAPAQLGVRPFFYIPWLTKAVVQSNIEVASIVLSPVMPLRRRQIIVTARPKSELGRVILANSITLTPGTVSVQVEGDQITVHALSFEGAAEDMSDEMNRRICQMERRG